MKKEIKVIQQDINDEIAIIAQWLVKDSDHVEEGTPIVELETSKAVFVLPAPHAGIIKILRPAGSECKIGEIIGEIYTDNTLPHYQETHSIVEENNIDGINAQEPSSAKTRITNKAKRLAEELGVDLANLKSCGIVREKDVITYFNNQKLSSLLKGDANENSLAHWREEPPKISDRTSSLYTNEFLSRIITGNYGNDEQLQSAPIRVFILQILISFVSLFIKASLKIPFIKDFIEIIAFNYPRNSFGFFFRGVVSKTKINTMGSDVIVDQGVSIWGGKNINIGYGCHIDTYARLAAGEKKQSQHGKIDIGNHVHIGPFVHIAGRGGVSIGDFTAITAGSKIFSATNNPMDPAKPDTLISMSHCAPKGYQYIHEAEVRIEDHVFLGLNVIVLPGVKIGRGSIIHSGAVITQNIPSFSIVKGSTGKIIGKREPK